jgi:hypothetical protein
VASGLSVSIAQRPVEGQRTVAQPPAIDTLAALRELVYPGHTLVSQGELARGAGTPADEAEELFGVVGVSALGKIRIRAEHKALQAPAAGGSGGAQPREAAGGAFTVGQHVEYQSKSKQTLVRSTVVKVHRDGALDLNREDMLHTRADPSLVQQFSRGEGGLGAVPAMASTLPSEGVLLGRT